MPDKKFLERLKQQTSVRDRNPEMIPHATDQNDLSSYKMAGDNTPIKEKRRSNENMFLGLSNKSMRVLKPAY